MQLIKSLFCLKGCDDRNRFLIINIATYIAFILLTVMLSPSFIAGFLVLVVSAFISALSIIRRLNDARLKKSWLPIATGLFLFCGCIIVFTSAGATYWLLLLPMGCLGILMTYPSNINSTYIWGYSGPVDLSQHQVVPLHHRQRIEPSVNGQSIHIEQPTQIDSSSVYQNSQHQKSPDIGEQIRERIFSNRNAVITLASVVALIIIGVTLSSLISSKPVKIDSVETLEISKKTVTDSLERLYPIEFSDGFKLMISQHSGLQISWQADVTGKTELWQQITAQGDSSCRVIRFNNKAEIRTISVVVENDDNYLAQFSPLDTELLLKHLAHRGSFSLCGYNFSLKGSQALLGNNPPYNNLASY